MRIDPTRYIWWLLSRSAGIVALVLISVSVLLGLTMATKILSRPGLTRKLVRLHEHVALVALAAIVVHGATLLGDHWLKAGVRGLIVPFRMGYRPLYTGLGMIGGYLAALLGLSFYLRRRIGTKLWRKLHRATVVVWALGIAHTIGAGSDAQTAWLRLIMLALGAPIVFLFLVRILHRTRPSAPRVGVVATPAAGAATGTVAVATAVHGQPSGQRPALAAAHADVRRHAASPASAAGVSARASRPQAERDDHARRLRPWPAIAEEPS
jgi:sulfoxide reductase heme-binding subunit YedZ